MRIQFDARVYIDRLAMVIQPAGATTGLAFTTQPQVILQNNLLQGVQLAGLVMTAHIASGSGALIGLVDAVTDAFGIATWTNLGIAGTGAHTISFTCNTLTPVTSASVTVAAVATKLAMSTQPGSTSVTGALLSPQPAVRLQDAGSNNISQAGVVVTVSIATGTGILTGIQTAVTNASGIATFTNLVISGAGAHTLRFTAIPAGLTEVISGTVTVSANVATKIVMVVQPGGAQPGVVFTIQPIVRIQDINSQNFLQAGVNVNVVIAAGSGVLHGTTNVQTDASGIATFTDLYIVGNGLHTLTFSSPPGLTPVTSGTFSVQVPGVFAPPSLADVTYENGLFTPWTNVSISGDPPWNAGANKGQRIINDPTKAAGGTRSRRVDYVDTPALSDDGSFAAFAFYTSPINHHELYWSMDVYFEGVSPSAAVKWQRLKAIDNPVGADLGGLYYSGGHITWCFGAEGQNQNCSLGIHKGLQSAALTSRGYTAYAENIQNSRTYHRIMFNCQRNPNGSTFINPRVRFWWDGLPIIQPNGPVYEENGNTTVAATWSAGDPADPDYGVNAPSWMTANTRGNSAIIRYLESWGTINKNSFGIGAVHHDNERISKTPIAP